MVNITEIELPTYESGDIVTIHFRKVLLEYDFGYPFSKVELYNSSLSMVESETGSPFLADATGAIWKNGSDVWKVEYGIFFNVGGTPTRMYYTPETLNPNAIWATVKSDTPAIGNKPTIIQLSDGTKLAIRTEPIEVGDTVLVSETQDGTKIVTKIVQPTEGQNVVIVEVQD